MIIVKETVMLDIRPVSDLRNRFADIEKTVQTNGPIILTKNGYGAMVVMSIEEYFRLTNHTEQALDEADENANNNPKRLNHKETFGGLRK